MSSGDGQKAQDTTESYNKRWGGGGGREEHIQSGNGIITSNDISQKVTALETRARILRTGVTKGSLYLGRCADSA